mgnify:CR=1 FL=1
MLGNKERIKARMRGIKRVKKVVENETTKLEDLINNFILNELDFTEHVMDIKIIENEKNVTSGIFYTKEGTWTREQIYYTAYIYVGGIQHLQEKKK